jgi:hypothetical protein
MQLGAIFVAFVVAAIVAAAEHVSVKYPRTWSYLVNCPSLYAYAVVYGIIAALLAWQLPALESLRGLAPEGVTSPWARAILVGLVAKALTGVNLMTLNINGTPIPLGTGILTRFFEPSLVRSMVFHEFQAVQADMTRVAALHNDIERVKAKAIEAVPPGLPPEDGEAFKMEVRRASSVAAVLSLYLGFAGRGAFRTVFEKPVLPAASAGAV